MVPLFALSCALTLIALDKSRMNSLRFPAMDMMQRAQESRPGLPVVLPARASALREGSLEFNPFEFPTPGSVVIERLGFTLESVCRQAHTLPCAAKPEEQP